MSHPHPASRSVGVPRLLALAAGLALLAGPAWAADKDAVGKLVSDDGTVLQRKAGSKQFEPLKKNADVVAGPTTLGVTGSKVDSRDGAVQLRLMTDLEGTSPHPIMEAAVVFKEPEKGVSFDLVLDRGRIALENLKDAEAKVRIHVRDEVWDLTLGEKALLGAEVYGRWPAGVFWHPKDNPPEAPTAGLVLLVLRGGAELHHGKKVYAMKAPPGPALYEWISSGAEDTGPKRLEELPEWAKPGAEMSPEAKKKLAMMAKFRESVLKNGLDATIAESLKSPDEGIRRIAVVALGASDNLPALIDALGSDKADVREDATLTLRHWIGRGPGQDAKVFEVLTKEKKYTPNQADVVMHLLHTPGPAQLADPSLWEAGIEYLKSDKVAIRQLAAFHLYRLVKDAKKIKYDPAGSKEQLEAAYKEWKKLVPDGSVPENFRPKKEKGKE